MPETRYKVDAVITEDYRECNGLAEIPSLDLPECCCDVLALRMLRQGVVIAMWMKQN